MDPVVQNERIRALSALGVFERSYNRVPGYPHDLWRSWGYTEADHEAGLWLLLIHPQDVARVARAYSSVLSGHSKQFTEEYRLYTPSNGWRWVMGAGRVIARDASGRPLRFLGTETDVTDRKRAEGELTRAKADAEMAAREAETLRQAGAIVASTLKFDEIVQVVLDQAMDVVPYDTATVQLLHDDYLEIVGGNGWANIGEVVGVRFPIPGDNPNSEVIQQRTTTRIGNVSERYPVFSATSSGTIHSWIGAPLVVRGDVVGLLTFDKRQRDFFTDAHLRLATAFADHVAVAIANSQRFEQTRTMAMTDSLTGLASRHALLEQADRLVKLARRYKHPLSILIMDLDHFKRFNDEHGHELGDRVLQLVAQAVKTALRNADVLCRYGGEELVALLPETEIDVAQGISERIRLAIKELRVPVSGHSPSRSVSVTVSIGIADLDLEQEYDIDYGLRRADKALYRSKAEGRDRCTVERRTE